MSGTLNDKRRESLRESLFCVCESGMSDELLKGSEESMSGFLSLILGSGDVEMKSGGDASGGDITAMLVTNLVKVAIARKQNFAGVVKAKRMGRTWGASLKSSFSVWTVIEDALLPYHHRLGGERKSASCLLLSDS